MDELSGKQIDLYDCITRPLHYSHLRCSGNDHCSLCRWQWKTAASV